MIQPNTNGRIFSRQVEKLSHGPCMEKDAWSVWGQTLMPTYFSVAKVGIRRRIDPEKLGVRGKARSQRNGGWGKERERESLRHQ